MLLSPTEAGEEDSAEGGGRQLWEGRWAEAGGAASQVRVQTRVRPCSLGGRGV